MSANSPHRRRFAFAALLLLVPSLLLSTGCGGGGSSSGANGNGTLTVVLADAPDPSITALNVTIDRVEAHVNGEWTPVTTVPQGFNLFDLVKNEAVLGSATLPAGKYTQIRFFPSAATVTDGAGTHDVAIAGGAQTGVKVNVGYEIVPEQVTTVLLDFNVSKSLIKQGNGQYRLQPVVPAVVRVLSGTVTGSVTDGGNALAGAEVSAVYAAGTSYPVGTEVNTSVTVADGTFKVWALLPGTYTLTVSRTDPATGAVRTVTRADVAVAANQNTDVGALAVP